MQNRVKKLRMRCGLTQTELAKEVGSTKRTIYSIETGEHDPRISLVQKLADFFGCMVEDLFYEDKPYKHREGEEKAFWTVRIIDRAALKFRRSYSATSEYFTRYGIDREVFNAYDRWIEEGCEYMAEYIIRTVYKEQDRDTMHYRTKLNLDKMNLRGNPITSFVM